MKKVYLLTLSLMGISLFVNAQENWCGTHERFQKVYENDPVMEQQMYEQLVRRFSNESVPIDRGVNGTIPVVVHIIHDGGTSNIGYDQVLDALDILNEDYQKLNADTVDTRNTANAPFAPIAANVGISFELAKLDPNGNCTNGVQRIYAPHLTDNAGDNVKSSANGGADPWPYDQYLNIWVVNSIESSGGAGITLGYAQFPYDYPPIYVVDPSIHGIVIRHDAFGTIGTSNTDGETLTHEVGHILGLFHTFEDIFDFTGDGCHTADCANNGDFVCDTPPVAEATWACNATQNTCTDIPANDYYGIDAYDQFENWMSYDNCQNMFSEGQKDRILTNMTDIAFLANWISATNQTATGVGLPAVLCEADFYSDKTIVCAGDAVQFFDQSYFNVTGTNWTFAGGSPGTSTDANPVITYNTPGLYSVTLEATDGVGSVSTTMTDYVLVLPSPGDPAPYFEGFETMSDLTDNDRFFIVNSNGGETWEHTDLVGIQGSKSAWINNYGTDDGSTDEMISGTIDLSGISASDPVIFTFKYAYKKRESSNDEWLKFYISDDCGETWVLRKSLHGNSLGSDVLSTPYTDVQDTDWKLVTVTNITSTYYSEHLRFKFEFINDNGNNIYLDDINLWPESMTGLGELNNQLSLSVYPNPANGEVTIELFNTQQQDYTIEIYNTLGEKIETIYQGNLPAGVSKLDYTTTNLAKGIYIVKITGNGINESQKLIVE